MTSNKYNIDRTQKKGTWLIESGGLTIGAIRRNLEYPLGKVGRYQLEIAGTKIQHFATLTAAKNELKMFFGTKTRSKQTY